MPAVEVDEAATALHLAINLDLGAAGGYAPNFFGSLAWESRLNSARAESAALKRTSSAKWLAGKREYGFFDEANAARAGAI